MAPKEADEPRSGPVRAKVDHRSGTLALEGPHYGQGAHGPGPLDSADPALSERMLGSGAYRPKLGRRGERNRTS